MTPIAKMLIASVLALAASKGVACATPTTLSFGIAGIGTVTVDTGAITTATATKTIPGLEFVSGSSTAVAEGEAGLADSTPVTFSTLTLHTLLGPELFTVSAGDLILTFTNVSSAIEVASGATSNGSISEQFDGSVTSDTSAGAIFLGQSAAISETCTQTRIGAAITCSDSVITPGLSVPEPISLAMLGVGIFGLGVARRSRT